MPATAAFCTISNDTRPETKSSKSLIGHTVCDMAPITLSTALCLPMSSRNPVIVPSDRNSAAACKPPVASKPG